MRELTPDESKLGAQFLDVGARQMVPNCFEERKVRQLQLRL